MLGSRSSAEISVKRGLLMTRHSFALSFCTRTAASGVISKMSLDNCTSSGFQYSGLPLNRIVASFTYSLNINGPVSTGFQLLLDGSPSLSNCAAYSADKIDAKGAASLDKKGA